MVVRIRFRHSSAKRLNVVAIRPTASARPAEPDIVQPHEIAAGAASLLWPVAAMVFALALWRLGQDLGLTASFFIQEGPFSHWQVWLALAVSLGAACSWLSKRGGTDDDSRATG
jgi:uncharacterized ferritin-like protein (DUF455 family)